MKSWLSSAVLAAAVVGMWSAPSSANTCSGVFCYELVTNPPGFTGDAILPGQGSMTFADTGTTTALGPNQDLYEFTLLTAGVLNVNANEQTLAGFSFASMSLDILNASLTPLDGVSGSNVTTLNLNNLSLSSGNYYVQILYSNPAAGLSYNGTVDAGIPVNRSETPVPGGLPLFAGGIALLGLLAWRRARKGQFDMGSALAIA